MGLVFDSGVLIAAERASKPGGYRRVRYLQPELTGEPGVGSTDRLARVEERPGRIKKHRAQHRHRLLETVPDLHQHAESVARRNEELPLPAPVALFINHANPVALESLQG